MALIRTEKIGDHIYWGIWDASNYDDVDTLLKIYPMTEAEKVEYNGLNHHFRKIEWLAGRLLLKKLIEEAGLNFNGTYKDTDGKCHLNENTAFVSLSHSRHMVAGLLSINQPVGIDIEFPHDKFTSIAKRFMNKEELAWTGNDISKITMAWTSKEAMYKQIGIKGMTIGQNFRIFSNTDNELKGRFEFGSVSQEHQLFHFKHDDWHIAISL